MRIELWGVRGSIPCSHPRQIKYGGNTSCIEIRTRSNDHIILDAGSGIRRLGARIMSMVTEPGEMIKLEQLVEFMVEDLMEKVTVDKPSSLRALEGSLEYKDEMNLFLTHYHWDHIQGFPFFIPAYIPGKTINIFGPLKADHRLRDVFSTQMGKTFFPVYVDQMPSKKVYHELVEDTVRIGDATVTSRHLNHPQGCIGYRITSGEMTVAYATDNEHPEKGLNENLLELADGADVLFYDSQYTPEEYESKKNWGHSTWEKGVETAREAGVKKLILWHHDPEHDDSFMEEIEKKAKDRFPNLMAAHEGMVIMDFPVEPTLDNPEPSAPRADLEIPPDLISTEKTLTITCGTSLRPLRNPDVRKEIESRAQRIMDKAIVDCSRVNYTDRLELSALADAVTDLNRSGLRVEIQGAGRTLHGKLLAARFPLVAGVSARPAQR